MNTNTHLSQTSNLGQDKLIYPSFANRSVTPFRLTRIIFKKKSTKKKDSQFCPETSKVRLNQKRNERYRTLPKVFASFSESQKSKQSTKNIYEHLRNSCNIKGVSTNSWCLYDSNSGEYFGFRQDYRRQVASLTKIMTTFLSISFLKQHHFPLTTLVRITKNAAEMIGTSANLKQGLWITLQDLLYGTMLPSGNDAAYTLAEYIGYLMTFKAKKPYQKILDLSKENTNAYVQQFVSNMDRKAFSLGLVNTKYSNPHGLQNALNTSSAKDIVKLSLQASKNKLFSAIMNTRYYKYQLFEDDDQRKSYLMRWWNTNKLLAKQWQGIKTGQTTSAGSCLSSLKNGIFITVLKSSNAETRFTDTQKIYMWYNNHIGANLQNKCNSCLDMLTKGSQHTLTQSSL